MGRIGRSVDKEGKMVERYGERRMEMIRIKGGEADVDAYRLEEAWCLVVG